jgi:Fe(3+) dicitrate transport protein
MKPFLKKSAASCVPLLISIKIYCLIIFLFLAGLLHGQDSTDHSVRMGTAYIEVKSTLDELSFNDSVIGGIVVTGKKSEIITLSKSNCVLSEKLGRQIFAKIPGAFVYDMDGTGNQLNIAFRGLDPHRGWEFTNRKDGILTNTDMYGYPASHFNVPLEAVERIEIVRGTGSLQYGAQFGGMLNYVTKAADSAKPLAFELQASGGSFNTSTAFARIHGTSGRWSYQVWVHGRRTQGYRQYAVSSSQAQSAVVEYKASSQLKLKLEWSRSQYLTELPGPLNDSMFYANPRQATRERNYYSPDIRIPSFQLHWSPARGHSLVWRTGYLTGERNSIMFDKPAIIPDTIDLDSFRFAKRQVDRDRYKSLTTELRYNLNTTLAGRKLFFTSGAQFMRNRLHRRQLGRAANPFGYTLDVIDGSFGRDLMINTTNVAVFFEGNYQWTNRISAGFGARYESGTSRIYGKIKAYPTDSIPTTIQHRFPLLGAFFQYKFNKGSIYSSISQAYRPVIFKDIIPTSVYEFTDRNVKDAFGYNAELGIRGNANGFTWDICAFLLRYNNRLGSYVSKDSLGNLTIYKTNVGNSFHQGLECYLEYHGVLSGEIGYSIYTSTSYLNATYVSGTTKVGNDNVSIAGNRVESAPQLTSRNGIKLQGKNVVLGIQYSYTAESYADPLNTLTPNVSGSVGLVPAYALWDASIAVGLSDNMKFTLQCTNMLNAQYFTKRPQFYPGPGIWPSDGRGVYTSFLFSL